MGSLNNIMANTGSSTPATVGSRTLEDEPIDDYDVFIDARLEGLSISAMADTGNLFRMAISKVLADKLGLGPRDIEPIPGYTNLGTAAEGGQLQVVGRVRRPLTLNLGAGTSDINVRPIVLANLSMHANLSGPFLRQHNIDIMSSGVARFQGKEIPLVKGNGDINALQTIASMVYTTETIKINPNEGMRIACVAKSVADGDMKASSLYVTGDGSYADKFDLHAVTSALVNVDSKGRLEIPTANTTGHPVVVPKGTLYGTAMATTTIDEYDMEPWKVCLVERPTSRQKFKSGGAPAQQQPPPRRSELYPQQQQQQTPPSNRSDDSVHTDSEPDPPDDDGFDYSLEPYMDGSKKLPAALQGPTTTANRRTRIKWLVKFFRLADNKHLKDKVNLRRMVHLLLDFWPIWSWSGEYGRTDLMEHRIDVIPGTHPIAQRHRPSNPLLDDDLKRQLDTWKRHGVIEESNSPWNFALVPAVKKGGRIRWCCGKLPILSFSHRVNFPSPQIGGNLTKSRLRINSLLVIASPTSVASPIVASSQPSMPWGLSTTSPSGSVIEKKRRSVQSSVPISTK